MKIDSRFALLIGCFVLSGAAGLVYQTAWTQELSLIFGTSELAVVTVLASYMAGLALGAAAAGRWARRITRPVLVYGLLELGIAVAALLVPLQLRLVARLHALVLGGPELPSSSESTATAIFYFGAAFAVLAVPTALMGATLPLLARHAVRATEQIGPRVGLLYTSNTGGAAVGTLLAAFLLLPTIGLRGTVLVAVALNVAVFGLAVLLARSAPAELDIPEDVHGLGGTTKRWVLPVMLGAGVVSFTWEVLWTRLLVHVLGSSVYSFATMLATFLVGIALGAALSIRFTRSEGVARRALAVAFLATAGLSVASFLVLDRMGPLFAPLVVEGAALRGAGLAASVLLPSTIAIGATFPLAVRVLAREAADSAPASAKVFAWNTVGAILGAVAAGYFLLPGLGFEGTATVAAIGSLSLALSIALRAPRIAAPAGLAAIGMLTLVLLPLRPPWSVLQHPLIGGVGAALPVTSIEVGRTATVVLTEGRNAWRLATNGLPESSIEKPHGRPSRYATARWLSLLPLLARPQTESVLNIGLGAGVTVEQLPESVREIHVIEIEPAVVRANLAVAEHRAMSALSDPRVQLHVNDARGALRLTERRFDAIISQPSHPWTAGAANLFSREFLELVSSRLSDDGVFVEWMGLTFVDEALLRSLVATATSVFPYVELYRPVNATALLLASKRPIDVASTAPEAFDIARDQWLALGHRVPQDLLATRWLDAEGARAFSEGARVSTDGRNLFRSRSALVLPRPLGPAGADTLLAPYEPLSIEKGDLYTLRRVLRASQPQRARRLVSQIPNPARSATGRALIELSLGQRRKAEGELETALRLDPSSVEARSALLTLRLHAIGSGAPLPPRLRALTEVERVVVEGLRFGAAGDATALQRLEPELAAIDLRHPLLETAVRLRAQWRAESGDPTLGEEALDLLEPLLSPIARPADLLLSSRAALSADRPFVAMSRIDHAIQHAAITPPLVRQARQLLERVPTSLETDDWRRELQQRIARK